MIFEYAFRKTGMTRKHKFIETIKELIQLHVDRVVLYQEALSTLLRPDRKDLKPIFGEMISGSIQFQQELKGSIAGLNGKMDGWDNEYKGAIYEVWESTRAPLVGSSSKSILETCEQECEAVRQAYQAGLQFSEPMDAATEQLLRMQQANLREIQDEIREYHDAL